MNVSHSTRTAILQFIDPSCAAAKEHVETRICSFFSTKLQLGRV